MDLSRPVGLLRGGVLACLTDRHAYPALASLHTVAAPGSWLVLTHFTARVTCRAATRGRRPRRRVLRGTPTPMRPRSRDAVARFFTRGWGLVGPGLVNAAIGRPDPDELTPWAVRYPADALLVGVARALARHALRHV